MEDNFETATKILIARLCPSKLEVLLSAQLMRRRQRNNENVDSYVQDFEDLFNQSYSHIHVHLKWQEKAQSSAESFGMPCTRPRVPACSNA